MSNQQTDSDLGYANEFHSDKQAQIIESEERLLASLKNSDVEQLDELLHDHLLFIIPNGQTITKAMDLAAYRSGHMSIEAIASSEQVINVIDDTAIVSVSIALQGKYIDQVLDGKFRYLRVWKLYGHQWKVIAGSCIPL